MNYPEDDFCGCCGRQIPGRPRFVRLWCRDCDSAQHRAKFTGETKCPHAVGPGNWFGPDPGAHLGSGK